MTGESGCPSSESIARSTTSTRLQDLGPIGPKGDRVRLSLRIVTHLSRAGVLPSDEIARYESTQEGIAQSLSVTQGAISKILGPLVAAEVVRGERRHVRGLDRRVKTYSLTLKGDTLAQEIHARFGEL